VVVVVVEQLVGVVVGEQLVVVVVMVSSLVEIADSIWRPQWRRTEHDAP